MRCVCAQVSASAVHPLLPEREVADLSSIITAPPAGLSPFSQGRTQTHQCSVFGVDFLLQVLATRAQHLLARLQLHCHGIIEPRQPFVCADVGEFVANESEHGGMYGFGEKCHARDRWRLG